MHCTKERFRCPAQNRNSKWLTSEGVEWKEGFDKKRKWLESSIFPSLIINWKLNPSRNAETNAMPCYLVSVEELGVLLVVRVLTERAGARQCPCVGCERSVALSTANTHGGVLLAVQPVTHISHLRLCCCVGVHCTIQHCLVTHISHLRLCCCCCINPHWLIFPTCFISLQVLNMTWWLFIPTVPAGPLFLYNQFWDFISRSERRIRENKS